MNQDYIFERKETLKSLGLNIVWSGDMKNVEDAEELNNQLALIKKGKHWKIEEDELLEDFQFALKPDGMLVVSPKLFKDMKSKLSFIDPQNN